jgi:A/G-specific adenine glycosylase
MELGSEVCRGRRPDCEVCPAAGLCHAQLRGLQNEIPRPKPRVQFEAVSEAAVLVRRRGRVLLIQWPEGRRWAGLWDFPRFPLAGESPTESGRELVEHVRALTGVTVAPGRHITTLTHGVTRFRITLDCYEAKYVSVAKKTAAPLETRWLRPAELDDYPLSSTGRKLANLMRENLRR